MTYNSTWDLKSIHCPNLVSTINKGEQFSNLNFPFSMLTILHWGNSGVKQNLSFINHRVVSKTQSSQFSVKTCHFNNRGHTWVRVCKSGAHDNSLNVGMIGFQLSKTVLYTTFKMQHLQMISRNKWQIISQMTVKANKINSNWF